MAKKQNSERHLYVQEDFTNDDLMEFCRGCIYVTFVGTMPVCDYMLRTGRRRPCPPGDQCTEKTTEKKRRRGKSHGNKVLDS